MSTTPSVVADRIFQSYLPDATVDGPWLADRWQSWLVLFVGPEIENDLHVALDKAASASIASRTVITGTPYLISHGDHAGARLPECGPLVQETCFAPELKCVR